MADGIRINDLNVATSTSSDDYIVINNDSATLKILASDFKKEVSTPFKTLIEEEANARTKADETLKSNIDNEVKARQSADNTLQTNIDNEKSQRLLNVDSLRTDINKCKKVFEYLNPADTTYLIRHDLSTKDFLINVYSINGKDLNPTIERLDGDNVQLTFEEVPSDFRVVIFAINEWALNQLAFNLPI